MFHHTFHRLYLLRLKSSCIKWSKSIHQKPKMNKYLSECRVHVSSGKPLCIVAGNETCDLDSAISSICFALFLSKNVEHLAEKAKKFPIIPMLNINRDEIPLKTDVKYFFQKNEIDISHLICCDEIPHDILATSDFILVDHHVSRFSSNAILVIDHRPFDEHSRLPSTCCSTIEQCGSCATLIGDYIIKAGPQYNRSDIVEIFKLLHGPIVLDTFNFSTHANRAQILDFEVTEEIEKTLNITKPQRHALFKNLFNARLDISSLNPLQILMKDLKIVLNADGSNKVAISSCTMLCQDFIKLEHADEHVLELWQKYKCDMLIILGLMFNDDTAIRDFGLINFTNRQLFDQIDKEISNDTFLTVKLIDECRFADGKFGSHNGRATRKHILPIVRRCLLNIV